MYQFFPISDDTIREFYDVQLTPKLNFNLLIYMSKIHDPLFKESIDYLTNLWKEYKKQQQTSDTNNKQINYLKIIATIIHILSLIVKDDPNNNLEKKDIKVEDDLINILKDLSIEIKLDESLQKITIEECLDKNLGKDELLNKLGIFIVKAFEFKKESEFEIRAFFYCLLICSYLQKNELKSFVLPLVLCFIGYDFKFAPTLLKLLKILQITDEQLIEAVNYSLAIKDSKFSHPIIPLFEKGDDLTEWNNDFFPIIKEFNKNYPKLFQHNNFYHPTEINVFHAYFSSYILADINEEYLKILEVQIYFLFTLLSADKATELIFTSFKAKESISGNCLHRLLEYLLTQKDGYIESSDFESTDSGDIEFEKNFGKEVEILKNILLSIMPNSEHLQQQNADGENLLHLAMQFKGQKQRIEIINMFVVIFTKLNILKECLLIHDNNQKTPCDHWLENITNNNTCSPEEQNLILRLEEFIPSETYNTLLKPFSLKRKASEIAEDDNDEKNASVSPSKKQK